MCTAAQKLQRMESKDLEAIQKSGMAAVMEPVTMGTGDSFMFVARRVSTD